MFGGKKKKILSDGISARAVVVNVQDTGMTVNDNPRVKLTLQVTPEGDAPFEVTKKKTVSRVSIPAIGDTYWVRFDPAHPDDVEFDTEKVKEINDAARAEIAAAAASALPPDLAQNGIPGRASCVEVQKTPIGQLVDCAMTVGVRLVDGTPPYQTSCRTSLSPSDADKLQAGGTLFTVRADPQNHERVALSLSEPTPVVTVTDATVLDPPARALRDGVPCRVAVLLHGRQWLKTPGGDEVYATKIRILDDGSEFQIFLPVPTGANALLVDGKELPAKRVPGENVATVDWDAARREAGMSVA